MAIFSSKIGQNRPVTRDPRRPMPPCILRLGWLGLKVADLMAETVFVERTLALKYLDEGNSNDGHHVRYDCGLELELVTGGTTWATRPKPRRGQPDLPLVPSFQVDDIGVVATRLNEQEVLLTQVFEQGWAANFLFFDPERNLWQVSQTRNEPATHTDGTLRLATLWLSVEDLPAQIAFYRDVIGLPLIDEDTRPRPVTLEAERERQTNPLAGPVRLDPDLPPDPTADELPQVRFDAEGNELSDHPAAAAVFFKQGVRLALAGGGKRLEDGAERVWGQDTAFLPGLQTNDLNGYAARLREANLKVTGPFPYYHSQSNRNQQAMPTQAIRFTDPEGHRWQVFE